jgi:hypothetical protein
MLGRRPEIRDLHRVVDDKTIIAAGAVDDSSPAICRKVVG